MLILRRKFGRWPRFPGQRAKAPACSDRFSFIYEFNLKIKNRFEYDKKNVRACILAIKFTIFRKVLIKISL